MSVVPGGGVSCVLSPGPPAGPPPPCRAPFPLPQSILTPQLPSRTEAAELARRRARPSRRSDGFCFSAFLISEAVRNPCHPEATRARGSPASRCRAIGETSKNLGPWLAATTSFRDTRCVFRSLNCEQINGYCSAEVWS